MSDRSYGELILQRIADAENRLDRRIAGLEGMLAEEEDREEDAAAGERRAASLAEGESRWAKSGSAGPARRAPETRRPGVKPRE